MILPAAADVVHLARTFAPLGLGAGAERAAATRALQYAGFLDDETVAQLRTRELGDGGVIYQTFAMSALIERAVAVWPLRQSRLAGDTGGMASEEWTNPDHVAEHLSRADAFPHRVEGESVLLEHIPRDARRILDLGTGDGRLLARLLVDRPQTRGVGLDFSPVMLDRARERFASNRRVELVDHNLTDALPALGHFDAVVSSMAIHLA